MSPQAVIVMKAMAGVCADGYAETYYFPKLRRSLGWRVVDEASVTERLDRPLDAVLAFLGHYAFARRGKERDDVSTLAIEAVNRLIKSEKPEDILGQSDGTILWDFFEEICSANKRRSNEPQNRGPLQGILELAQEIHRANPNLSLATWIVDDIRRSGRLEPCHFRLVDIRGVGPKGTSTFLRDVVWLYDVESQIQHADRIYVQPVDRWLRQIVDFVVPEEDRGDRADWIIAGKVSKYARRAGVSGVRFNMGVTFFGQRRVHRPENLADALRDLLLEETSRPKSPDPGEATPA